MTEIYDAKRQEQAKKIAQEPFEQKISDGNNFGIDEERNIATYNPNCNNYGKRDASIEATIKNMLDVANFTRFPVEAKFTDTVFQVVHGMTHEQAKASWEKAKEENRRKMNPFLSIFKGNTRPYS